MTLLECVTKAAYARARKLSRQRRVEIARKASRVAASAPARVRRARALKAAATRKRNQLRRNGNADLTK